MKAFNTTCQSVSVAARILNSSTGNPPGWSSAGSRDCRFSRDNYPINDTRLGHIRGPAMRQSETIKPFCDPANEDHFLPDEG
jgi:hypothetical protein